MLCIPIIGPTPAEIKRQVHLARAHADLLEIRIDLSKNYTLQDLDWIKENAKLPVIFTFRNKNSPEEIKKAASLYPEYLDLDHQTPRSLVEELKNAFPTLKIILSYHNFDETPRNLEAVLNNLKKTPAHFYKMACYAQSTNDALRMLIFVKEHAPLIGICMGERGEITRIAGPVIGAPWTYASLSPQEKSADGQIPYYSLDLKHLTKKCLLFGLIGETVTQSISHISHNRYFKNAKIDALYLKMPLRRPELPEFFTLAGRMGFSGLSVTMPFKEDVLRFADTLDAEVEKIGAANTLHFKPGNLHACNTDGLGALDAIEEKCKVSGKKMLILGAGGSARGILHEALKRGAKPTILNRTLDHALTLAKYFSVPADSLSSFAKHTPCDILINTTPSYLPISPDFIAPPTLVMDIKTLPQKNSLLEHAQKKGCPTIPGHEMFFNQALRQFHLWLGK